MVQENRLRLKSYGTSDIGLVRTNNEDAWHAALQDALFLVADGLGGHQSGEIASKEAIEFFLQAYQQEALNPSDDLERLYRSFRYVNREIYSLSYSHELLKGMGTTLIALHIKQEKAFICHVGDSRIYRFNKIDQEIEQITQDHLISLGRDRPMGYKGYLTKAIGTQGEVSPDLLSVNVKVGDIFLMCTDGLSDMMKEVDMAKTLSLSLTLEQKVRMLISMAKGNGGVDNITVLLIEVV